MKGKEKYVRNAARKSRNTFASQSLVNRFFDTMRNSLEIDICSKMWATEKQTVSRYASRDFPRESHRVFLSLRRKDLRTIHPDELILKARFHKKLSLMLTI